MSAWTVDELARACRFLSDAYIGGGRDRELAIELCQSLSDIAEPPLRELALKDRVRLALLLVEGMPTVEALAELLPRR